MIKRKSVVLQSKTTDFLFDHHHLLLCCVYHNFSPKRSTPEFDMLTKLKDGDCLQLPNGLRVNEIRVGTGIIAERGRQVRITSLSDQIDHVTIQWKVMASRNWTESALWASLMHHWIGRHDSWMGHWNIWNESWRKTEYDHPSSFR